MTRLDVCAFMASLCDAAGRPLGREKYLAEIYELVWRWRS